jgi:hypothetical protein
MTAKPTDPRLLPRVGIQSLLADKQRFQDSLAELLPEHLLRSTMQAVLQVTLRGLRRQRWKPDTALRPPRSPRPEGA